MPPAKKAVARKAVAERTSGRKTAGQLAPGTAGKTKPLSAEIRVHGVGGSSPASILGLATDSDAELVASGDRTGVWRRKGTPEIQGYVWGGLTSGSRLQPFWLLLLPFTLVNVAGWMHDASLRPWRVHGIRRVAFTFGLTTTATYVVWAAAMLEDSVGARWLPQHHKTIVGHWRTTPRWGVVLGGVAMMLILGALSVLANSARRGESITEAPVPDVDDDDKWKREVFAGSIPENTAEIRAEADRANKKFETRGGRLGVGAKKMESLRNRSFFNRAGDSWVLLRNHVIWTGALIVGITALAYGAATAAAVPRPAPKHCQPSICWQLRHHTKDEDKPSQHKQAHAKAKAQKDVEAPAYLTHSFEYVGGAQVLLLLALLGLSAARSKRDELDPLDPDYREDPNDGDDLDNIPQTGTFRWCGPAIACGLSVMIANAMFAGASRALDKRLGIDAPNRFIYADLIVLTLLIVLGAFAVWGFRHHVFFPEDLPEGASDGPGEPLRAATPYKVPPDGVTPSQRTLTARFRALTKAVTHVDLVLTESVIAFGVLALIVGAARVGHPDRGRIELLAIAGTQLVVWLGGALVAVLWFKRKDPKTRKTVGIVWDLLTFWPRRFHPFAVRPYSEQAVPELRGAITRLNNEHGHVLVSCHSQGTVLSFAAIAPLVYERQKRAAEENIEATPLPVTIVTYGSHLGGLFRVFFPAYFAPAEMSELRDGVYEWRNFRRRTDPIASKISGIKTEWLYSPDVKPSPGPGLVVPETAAEGDRVPWTKVETHSNYRNEPVMKRAIDELRQPSPQ